MKWISVKERLPEDKQNILFITNSNPLTIHHGNYYDESKNFLSLILIFYNDNTSVNISSRFPKDSVTHWMPIPEPPNEDE